MKKKLHAIAGAIALLTISTFWGTTVASKLFGTVDQIILVKTSILWGMLLLIPAMATTGASGFSLGGKWKNPLMARKKTRMKIAAANGILLLVPSAFFLAAKAQAQEFDGLFLIVQVVELIAGATNFTLLFLNARDGFAISRRKQ
ncbi:MAG: hypothetical protein GY761_02115 [Hyphomicrobiales bacterium]|nr:hypothetical protein [Hyphomicrobiales bacterium]